MEITHGHDDDEEEEEKEDEDGDIMGRSSCFGRWIESLPEALVT